MAFTKKGVVNPKDNTTTKGAKAGGAPTDNNWVKEAMAGTYQFNTGGTSKKGKRPGFSKGGKSTAAVAKKRKGMVPTHGTEERGEKKAETEAQEMAE